MTTETKQSAEVPKEENNNKQIEKRKRGRPPKALVESKKAGNRKKVGRPKGDAAILKDYRSRMIASPKSRAILGKIMDIALDDNHPHQAAMLKEVAARLIPVSSFTAEGKSTGGKSININISTVGDTVVSAEEEPVDAEYEEIDD